MRLENSPELFKQDCELIIRESPYLFKNLHQKKLLITGVSGFFGSWVLEVLNQAIDFYSLETEVFCLVRKKLNLNKNFSWLKEIMGDLKSFNIQTASIVSPLEGETGPKMKSRDREGVFFDFVLHMAGNKSWEDVVLGTENLIKNLSQQGGHIDPPLQGLSPRLVFTSSGAVYGKKIRTDQPLSENLKPELWGADWYSKAKYQAENNLLDFAKNNKNFNLIIARCFAFYGYGQPVNQGFAVADMCEAAKKNKLIKINNKSTERSFMYMGDLVRALFLLLLSRNPHISGIYNIGGEHSENIINTAEKIAKKFQAEILISQNLTTRNYYVPSIQKLKNLGFVEKFYY